MSKSEAELVRVELSDRSYDIDIDSGSMNRLGSFIADRQPVTHAAVITDSNVQPHAARGVDSLQQAGIHADLFVVPAGESSKSVAQLNDLWMQLREAGADRKSIVVAIGGGVVGDLAGFVAASYGRGVPYYQVPTTLLSQVDSSVGGKVGINLPTAKNMVGAFWQPQGVLIDLEVLKTLPEREFKSGMAEVVKYGVIMDAPFFDFVESRIEAIMKQDPDQLKHVIAQCCRLKAVVVQQDERETSGLRAILNYGHTFAHAFEAVFGFGNYRHGEAVSVGMLCASRLAESLNMIDAELTQRQVRLLDTIGLPVDPPCEKFDELLASMQKDKKVEHGRLKFILPAGMGEMKSVGDVDPALVLKAISRA